MTAKTTAAPRTKPPPSPALVLWWWVRPETRKLLRACPDVPLDLTFKEGRKGILVGVGDPRPPKLLLLWHTDGGGIGAEIYRVEARGSTSLRRAEDVAAKELNGLLQRWASELFK